MGSIAQAMQDSMMGMAGQSPQPIGKVITGLHDVIDKRSNSQKPKSKIISPPKGGGSSSHNIPSVAMQQHGRTNSPGKGSYSPKHTN